MCRAGGTQRLSRLIGLAKAKELIYTGRILDAQQALKEGIPLCCRIMSFLRITLVKLRMVQAS
jgi:hypothetical protein